MASTNSTKRSKKRPPYTVSGKFKCPDCFKRWKSSWTWIRKSLRGNEYPLFGQKCNTEDCLGGFINPYAWEPLPRCSSCNNEGSKCRCESMINTHRRRTCGRCQSGDPCPYVPYRVYGWFECKRCENEWQSAYAWAKVDIHGNETPAYKQQCRNEECHSQEGVFPVNWEPLKCPNCEEPVTECECLFKDSRYEDERDPHLSQYCEKCKSKNPCRR